MKSLSLVLTSIAFATALPTATSVSSSAPAPTAHPSATLVSCEGSWCPCAADEKESCTSSTSDDSTCDRNTLGVTYPVGGADNGLPSGIQLEHRAPDLSAAADGGPSVQNATWTVRLDDVPAGRSLLLRGPSYLDGRILRWLPAGYELTMDLGAWEAGENGEKGTDLTSASRSFTQDVYKSESPVFFSGRTVCTTEENSTITLKIDDSATAAIPSTGDEEEKEAPECPDENYPCNDVEYLHYGLRLVWTDCEGNEL